MEASLLSEIGDHLVPREYVDFQLCREFGWTPEYVRNMDQHDYDMAVGFMRAEGYAATMKQRHSDFLQHG